jgi:hypothetical protein
MITPMAAADVLDREFLQIRAGLIDVAAALDRIDRAVGSAGDDPHLEKIRQAAQVLAGEAPHRAERVQSLFSLPYQDGWRRDYDL